METVISLPVIAPGEFLGIFVVSTMVLILGVGYAALVTFSKMGYLSKKWLPVSYIFWIMQGYSLYDLSVRIHSSPFTFKVLMVAMVAYLFAPHLYFYLVEQAEKRYDQAEETGNQPVK